MAKDDKKHVKQQEDNVVLTGDDPKRLAKEQRDERAKDGQPAQAGEVAELKEQILRARADFENFKRRTEEQRTEVFDLAKADLALAILPVIDNFDRATKHVPEDVAGSDWYQGFLAIQKQFEQLLASMGIARIESVGQSFNPERHEAVAHEPSDDYDKDVISEEFEAGYQVGESILRPAKVRVSSGKPDGASIPGKDPGSKRKASGSEAGMTDNRREK